MAGVPEELVARARELASSGATFEAVVGEVIKSRPSWRTLQAAHALAMEASESASADDIDARVANWLQAVLHLGLFRSDSSN